MDLSEFINVSEERSEWQRHWGMLIGGTLTLAESKTSEKPTNVIKVQDVELQPAVKETGRMLAFKLVDKGKTLVILEPLNITDMGRWVSSLFAAIQGLANCELSNAKLEKKSKAADWEDLTAKKQMTIQRYHSSIPSEPQDVQFTVKVRDLAKIFENLSSASQASKTSEVKVRRSLSSPNLSKSSTTTTTASSPAKPVVVDVIHKQETKVVATAPQVNETAPQLSHAQSHKPPAKTSKTTEIFTSHKGNYLDQESEKEVLANLMNPQLAKQRHEKQLQTIQRLEVTMKSVIEKIKRQKKSLEETEAAIKELESQATTPEDYNDVAKLQDQKIKLQQNISHSEASIEEYKTYIATAENELRQLAKVISAAEAPSSSATKVTATAVEAPSSVKTYESIVVVTEQTKISVNHDHENHEPQRSPSGHVPKTPSLENGSFNKNEPEWISKARQKSEAIQKLAEEGRLD